MDSSLSAEGSLTRGCRARLLLLTMSYDLEVEDIAWAAGADVADANGWLTTAQPMRKPAADRLRVLLELAVGLETRTHTTAVARSMRRPLAAHAGLSLLDLVRLDRADAAQRALSPDPSVSSAERRPAARRRGCRA